MFRKIVSNLPFSPALVGQLGFYAKRLRQEETTRRLGLIFVALALIVQLFAVFQPSESANATDTVKSNIGNNNLINTNVIKSKIAKNSSQGFIDATTATANADDQISYTITVENIGLRPEAIKLEEKLSDVLEYAMIVDNGGGILNESTKTLSWADLTLNPKDKQTRTFAVKVLSKIPATATSINNTTSFDCKMSNVFGNSIDINVGCPTPKIVESVASELPKTGPTENMIFAGIVLGLSTYFYARNRQLKKEVYLIRKNVSIGTI